MRTKTNPPYESPELNLRFMEYAHQFGAGTFENPAVSDIAVVGGTFNRNYDLYPGDIATVERALKVMKQAGISMSPLLRFHFYNLLAPIKSDFMRAAIVDKVAPKTDALILCGLCGSRSERSTIHYMNEDQREVSYANFNEMYNDYQKGYFLNREVSISHIQLSPEGWSLAAKESGAKIVMTRGGDHDEINSRNFLMLDFYKTAIDTKEEFETVWAAIPGPLGIVVANTALDELKSTAKPANLLGQRILAM